MPLFFSGLGVRAEDLGGLELCAVKFANGGAGDSLALGIGGDAMVR